MGDKIVRAFGDQFQKAHIGQMGQHQILNQSATTNTTYLLDRSGKFLCKQLFVVDDKGLLRKRKRSIGRIGQKQKQTKNKVWHRIRRSNICLFFCDLDPELPGTF